MALTAKENYLRTLDGEIPEYTPSWFTPYIAGIREELLTPATVPDGKPFITSLGVEYVGSKELNYGAMPAPGKIVIDDITKWHDQLKIRDVTGRDWEGYYKKQSENIDRKNLCVAVDGGDYFLTLVALMGFEQTMLALYEEPEEVKALLTEISNFYLMVTTKQMEYLKPDLYILMDDDSAYRRPFFSLDIYRDIFKPFHKKHCELALEHGCKVLRHDCGRSEQFIDDWLEIGVCSWNPAQTSNDCVGIKKKYGDRLTLEGAWDSLIVPNMSDDELIAYLDEYCETFLPGGRFVFSANTGRMVTQQNNEPDPQMDLIRKYYEDNVRDWYKKN
ncbi:MAG: hypothetical protein IJ072_06905 [Oscillospiraceae bacterium]|nr:hypothetical protein [Oscillospiraceae bacterium]